MAYNAGSPYIDFNPGDYSFVINARTPVEDTLVFGPQILDLLSSREYNILALGDYANLEFQIVEKDLTAVAAGSARIQLAHTVPDLLPLDIYVTTLDANLSASAPVATLAFRETAVPMEFAAGEYQIRITPAGFVAAVIFDSGAIDWSVGDDFLIAVMKNFAVGPSAVNLVATDGASSVRLYDKATAANVRFGQLSPDAPPIDVALNDNFASPIVAGLAYPAVTNYRAITPAPDGEVLNLKVTPAGNSGSILIDQDVGFRAGDTVLYLLTDSLADVQPLSIPDDNRGIITQATVRIIHAAPSSGDVDIYVTPVGVDFTTVAPAIAAVPFRTSTGYTAAVAGDLTLTITAANSTMPIIDPIDVTLENGKVYTAIARDAVGGGAPVDLVLLDDF